MDVSIVIVNYNTQELLFDCLVSIYRYTKLIDFEVIISDNGSIDGSIEMIKESFPDVILIENKANLGFAKANNIALNKAKGKYIFYLNSDTVLLNNAVKYFYDYWEKSPEKKFIGAIGTNLQNLSGDTASSYGVFPTCKSSLKSLIGCFLSMLHLRKPENLRKNKYSTYYGDVDFIIGADLFLKNDEYAVFDERFFMYFEETDMQLRMQKKDKKRTIIKGPEIIHLSGGSDKNADKYYSFNKKSTTYYWKSCLEYLYKNEFHKRYIKIITNILLLILVLPNNKKNNKDFIKDLKTWKSEKL